MRNENVERRVNEAMEHAAPDVLDRVMAERGRPMQPVFTVRRKRRWTALAAAAAALALVIGGGFGWNLWQASAVASIVSLNVNPSIELKVNSREKVISCTALNADAARVLYEMDGGEDLKGAKLDLAVNAIVGALVRHGYLDSIDSVLTISVEDKDRSRADRIQQELTQTAEALLRQQSSSAVVQGQVVGAEGSPAPSPAASAPVWSDPPASSSPAPSSPAPPSPAPSAPVTPAPSSPTVDEETAKAAALAHAGVTWEQATGMKVERDWKDGRLVYEVEFRAGGREYEYVIDGTTGEVAAFEWKDLSPGGPSAPPSPAPSALVTPAPSSPTVDEETAKAAALAHAGVTREQTTGMKVERDWKDGRLVYEVEFRAGGREYEYVIDGTTGEIYEFECEWEDSSGHGHEEEHHWESHHSGTAATLIGGEAAKSAALLHAGVSAADVIQTEAELDTEGGLTVYEVEFETATREYEYRIDAYTGQILKAHWEHHD